jgi:hypothetical protein
LKTIPIDEIRDYFSYNPSSGEIKNLKYRSPRALAGQISTWDQGRYLAIRFKGNRYAAHRVAWLLVHGSICGVIDHINGNTYDNRLSNLRCCSVQQNMCNQKNRKPNSTGLKGAYRDRNSFKAQITYQGKVIRIGTFKTAQEAHLAYCKVAKELNGEFATFEYS